MSFCQDSLSSPSSQEKGIDLGGGLITWSCTYRERGAHVRKEKKSDIEQKNTEKERQEDSKGKEQRKRKNREKEERK